MGATSSIDRASVEKVTPADLQWKYYTKHFKELIASSETLRRWKSTKMMVHILAVCSALCATVCASTLRVAPSSEKGSEEIPEDPEFPTKLLDLALDWNSAELRGNDKGGTLIYYPGIEKVKMWVGEYKCLNPEDIIKLDDFQERPSFPSSYDGDSYAQDAMGRRNYPYMQEHRYLHGAQEDCNALSPEEVSSWPYLDSNRSYEQDDGARKNYWQSQGHDNERYFASSTPNIVPLPAPPKAYYPHQKGMPDYAAYYPRYVSDDVNIEREQMNEHVRNMMKIGSGQRYTSENFKKQLSRSVEHQHQKISNLSRHD